MKPPRPALYSYAVAVLTVSVATALKLLLAPAIDKESPFLIYFAAVMLTAWRGGLLPGLLATLLAATIADYLFLTPTYALLGHDAGQDLRLLMFIAEGALMSVLSVALRSERWSGSHAPLVLRCGVAVMTAAAVFGLKLLLDPLITTESPFLLFFSSVIISVWYGGLVPGLLAVFVSAVLSDYFFLSPIHSLLSKDFGQNLRLGIFVCEGTLITVLGWAARKSAMRKRDVLFSLSPDMIGKINRDGFLERVNPAFVHLLGRTEEELMAKPLDEFVHADDRSKYTAEISKLRDGVPVSHFEIRLLGPDDSDRWLSWSVARVEGGDSLYVVAQDLTAQKKAEEDLRTERERAEAALRHSERYYRSLIEHSSDVITVLDADGRVLYKSPSIRHWRGFEPSELIGQQVRDFVHADDLAAFEEGFAFNLSQPGVPIKFECRLRHKDGSWRHVEGTSVNLLTDPAIGGIIINTRDTTERKQIEAALRESEERLRHAQRMEAAGQLAGGIAHDFNNLLTVINGYSELLLHRPVIDERAREKVSQIHKAGVRAAALTRQLLAFSRKQMLQPKLLDVNALVSDLHTLLRRLIGEHITVVLVLDASAGFIKADPGQIEQVIINLVINARDAMPDGGTLTIATGNVVFDEASADDEEAVPLGDYVTLIVSDTGVGMTVEVKRLAFEPFFTTKEFGKGTGLGLSTVYGIVTQSGGNIRVKSKQDVGTTIRIYLLRVDEPYVPTATPSPPHAAPRGAETILLVEDEQGVRVMAREILEASGYRVIVAGHGEQALEISEKHKGTIHLLVTDIVMPQMGGRQLAERLLAARPGLKVLYISGYTDDMIVHRDVHVADIAYLPKPFTPGDLKTKVRDVIDAE
ncbi:MAG: DUF4118 domain-containing protein [Acidobacteriota bacterium]|nr:DUF4118 domain-containing protein [Acidobacteriota bacterium]